MCMRKNVALVLSSGGARGIAQIGAINELKKNGFEITSVSGSSIGSLIGGIYAMGRLDDFSVWVSTLNRLDVFNIMDFTLSSHGILKVEKLFKIIEKDFPDMMIEDLNIPYVAMATDVANNKEVKFTSGSVYKAIRASIALPALIKSVQNSDQVLVDGGVLNPIPIRQIQRTPDDIVVVVNLYDFDQEPEADAIILHNSDEVISHPTVSIENNTDKSKLLNRGQKLLSTVQKKASVSNNYASILSKVTTMMLQVNAFSAIELHKPDIVINIPRSSAGTFDFHKSEELIKIGQLATQKSIRDFVNKQ